MNPPTAWQRLVAAARRAPDERDISAPFGFAARVAALAMVPERRPASLFDQFSLRVSLRVLGAASVLAVAAATVSYPALVSLFSANAMPASSLSSLPSSAGADLLASPEAVEAPSAEAPSAPSASGDDPVAELVDIAS